MFLRYQDAKLLGRVFLELGRRKLRRGKVVRSAPNWDGVIGVSGRTTLADGRPIQLLPTSGCKCEFCRYWGSWPK